MGSVSFANYIIYGLLLGILSKFMLKLSDLMTIKFVFVAISVFFIVDTGLNMLTDRSKSKSQNKIMS